MGRKGMAKKQAPKRKTTRRKAAGKKVPVAQAVEPPVDESRNGRRMMFDRGFDVVADPVDLRDIPYRPPLKSLPSKYPAPNVIVAYLPSYACAVLDQGSEGACTGFGLAAVINFLRWSWKWRGPALNAADPQEKLPHVDGPRPEHF